MITDDAILILRRYQRWRRGTSEKTFEEYGLDVKEIGEALDHVLSTVISQTREIASLRSRLAKCQVQREKFHSQLRKKASSSSPSN